MNGEQLIGAAIVIVIILPIIMSVFFFLRSIPRFREWRDGEKDELWMFIAFLVGGVGAILISIGIPAIMFGETEAVYNIMPAGLIIGLIAIGLTTVYYIFKWLHSS